MLCRKPFFSKGASFGCGQCMHCRYNRRRLWTHRIILEAVVHPTASFLTLTYNDANLPDAGSLVPRDVTLFLKRLRKNLGDRKIRYFAVGEYGDETWRPHYHLALFGVDHADYEAVEAAWPCGFIYFGDLTWESAGYIAGYVTKKMTSKDDVRLNGLYPEYATMSLRPGIGALSVAQIAAALSSTHGQFAFTQDGDVPDSLLHGRKSMPLGRYIRRKLREALDIQPGDNRAQAFEKSAEMLVMYQNYLIGSERETPFAVLQERKLKQKLLNRETRRKIFDQKKGVI